MNMKTSDVPIMTLVTHSMLIDSNIQEETATLHYIYTTLHHSVIKSVAWEHIKNAF